jgi:hypothetical protein
MLHIDDYLVSPNADPVAKRFFDEARKPAYLKNYEWMKENPLFCTYGGQRYRCTGASRLGDVWLTADFRKDIGYDLRVDVAMCSEWSKTPAAPGKLRIA